MGRPRLKQDVCAGRIIENMQWFSVEVLVKGLVNAAMLKRFENRQTYHKATGLREYVCGIDMQHMPSLKIVKP